MKSFLLWALAIGGMFATVPLTTWLATGSAKQALWAAKRFGLMLGLLIGLPMLAGLFIAGIGLLLR